MEFIIEFFVEFFGYVYLNFAMSLVPDKKLKKWQLHLLNAISLIISLYVLASLCFGITLLIVSNDNSQFNTGLGLTISGGLLLLIQIILYVITKKREMELKKKKAMEHKYKKLQEQNEKNTNEIIIEQDTNQINNKQDWPAFSFMS